MANPNKSAEAAAAVKVVQLLEGPVKAARRLGVERYQTVQSWTRNGIPVEYCAAAEHAVGGAVTRREMKPGTWQRVWPELAASATSAGESANA